MKFGRLSEKIRFIVLIFIICYNTVNSYCQNLVANSSFEQNTAFISLGNIKLSENFDNVISWKILGWQSFYCHSNLINNNWYISTCRPNQYNPRSGDAMIKMVYEEGCLNDQVGTDHERNEGCSSYIESKLIHPLEVGSVYEISFWMYYPKDTYVEQTILGNIGFIPTLRANYMSGNNMLRYNRVFNDSIKFDQWFQIKKYIRALCPLEYILIGTFRNDSFPTIHRHTKDHYTFYFVDDVSVRKVNENEIADSILPTAFCKFYNDEIPFTKRKEEHELILYYESGDYALSKTELVKLDQYLRLEEQSERPVYTIVGHTDNTGDENQQLSIKRSSFIANYLANNYSIPNFRIVSFGAGDKSPIVDNLNSDNRSQNRRVVIKTNLLSIPKGMYRQALTYLKLNELAKAGNLFVKWIQVAPFNQKMAILHDPRLECFKNHPLWRTLVSEVKISYSKYSKPNDSFFLDSMYFVDQRHRSFSPHYLTGFIKSLDTFDFKSLDADLDQYKTIDSINMISMKRYLNKNGFPKISEVGKRQVRTVGYMIIHNEDSLLLGYYLPIVQMNCLEGESEWDLYAMMLDKYKWCKGEPQFYGTQSVYIDDKKSQLKLYKVDSIEAVNERRKKIGLSPILDENEIITLKKI